MNAIDDISMSKCQGCFSPCMPLENCYQLMFALITIYLIQGAASHW